MAGTITATWTKIAAAEQLQRSSHTLSIVGSRAYIFGGELKPREPRDNELFTIDVDGGAGEVQSIKATATTPSPRVGAATATLGEKVYMFSGRGGPAMAPVDEQGGVWVLDTKTETWELVEPASSTWPEARSYYCMASDGEGTLFVHAGCPEKGRRGDLWAFDVGRKQWREVAAAPDPPRGGTSIAFAEGKIWRMNGFDGTREQGGQVDVYDLEKDAWSSVTYEADGKMGPGARSVAALLPVNIGGEVSLVTLFGESDPSSLGHQGAGKMLSDIWAYSLQKRDWSRIETQGEDKPEARGWFDADVVSVDGKEKVVVAGGLGGTNERLNDVWLLNF